MVRTIPGFTNRGSSDMYRPARQMAYPQLRHRSSRQSVGPQRRSCAVSDQRQQTVIGETVEAPGDNTLRGSDGSGYVASCGSRVRRDVCEDRAVTAVATLQQILAEQASGADAKAQRRGERSVVPSPVGRPRVQRA
jgi:hypothetical protein